MKSTLHLHLDPVGGLAGDMFVAALLDAWPALADGAIAAIRSAGLGDEVRIQHRPHHDDVLVGSRFSVVSTQGKSDHHAHVHWRDLRENLRSAALNAPVRDRALAIFSHLAEAEAGVHGVAVDDATFHEVGAWDSIADIVAAAFLIETTGAEHWSVGSLPLGRGKVQCAHGELPVPAPATVRLLEGFTFHDDGRSGERVTPTGAAILKHLIPSGGPSSLSGRLTKTGHGFGMRKLDGISNVLRVMAFEVFGDEEQLETNDSVAVLSFEIDDQTPEDLAIGLDRLRARDDVLDIVQTPVFGKKGRLTTSLRLLVRPESLENVIETCFAQTTTLGVRWHIEQRVVLPRRMATSDAGVAVKLARRPHGSVTAKAESADVADLADYAERDQMKRSAELETLSRLGKEDQT